MTIAYVQSNIAVTVSASSLGCSLSGVAGGNLIVVGIVTSGAGTSVSGVSDGTNTYTRRSGRKFLAGAGGSEIWEAHNVTGGSLTITASFSGSVAADVIVAEYSGLDTSSPFDVQNSNSGTSASPDSGTATTTVANELLVGMCSNFQGAAPDFTAGTSFTTRQQGQFNSAFEDRIVSSTGSYSANGSLTDGSQVWTMCLATFKASSAGGTVTSWANYYYRDMVAGAGGAA